MTKPINDSPRAVPSFDKLSSVKQTARARSKGGKSDSASDSFGETPGRPAKQDKLAASPPALAALHVPQPGAKAADQASHQGDDDGHFDEWGNIANDPETPRHTTAATELADRGVNVGQQARDKGARLTATTRREIAAIKVKIADADAKIAQGRKAGLPIDDPAATKRKAALLGDLRRLQIFNPKS